MRLASSSENFPYTGRTVCFLEVDAQDHVHEIEWKVNPRDEHSSASYIGVEATLACDCEILSLRTFAEHMKAQRGWDVAVSSGWGSSAGIESGWRKTYSFRVRRKSPS